jgi:hypothetical protein
MVHLLVPLTFARQAKRRFTAVPLTTVGRP